MDNSIRAHLHPVERAGALEGRLRRLLHNPKKLTGSYIRPGMTVLDLGCGTGFFTVGMAELLGGSGKVIAIDVQEEMLDILRQKLGRIAVSDRIEIRRNSPDHIGVTDKVDFVLAFYAFHEMEYPDDIVSELKGMLTPGAKILIAEQKFHVSKRVFNTIIGKLEDNGFVVCSRPKIFFSRAAVMKIRD